MEDTGWMKGPIVRVRCMNDQCGKYRKGRVVRVLRMGDVMLWGPFRCLGCMHEMQVVNTKLEPGREKGV